MYGLYNGIIKQGGIIMQSINITQLHYRCNQSRKSIFTKCETIGNTKTRYRFIDNGGDILFVVHADNVINSKNFRHKNNRVYSPNLDDRLGLYLALDYFPSIGIIADVLITDNEEIGQSTARYFETNKHYNWICELDRRGTDSVSYMYNNDNWIDTLSYYFGLIGYGGYSDICELEYMKTSCFNLGIGYHKQHSLKCYCDLKELYMQIDKFVKFYNDCKDIVFSHSPYVYEDYTYDYDSPEYYCSMCNMFLYNEDITHLDGYTICGYCYNAISETTPLDTIGDYNYDYNR